MPSQYFNPRNMLFDCNTKRWWMVREFDGNENERRSSVRLQWAGKYWKVRWLYIWYIMKLLKLRARQKVSSFFSRTFQTICKVQQCCLPLGLGQIRLTSRAYDYMNTMWILRRRIIEISFIFGKYDVNIWFIFATVHILTMTICKKTLVVMLI